MISLHSMGGINKSWGTEGTAVILLIQRWDHNHRWNCQEMQKNNSTSITARHSPIEAVSKSKGIEKTMLLPRESIYWVSMNANIAVIKHCSIYHDFQATWPKDKKVSHEILVRPLEFVEANVSTVNNRHYLCIVDYCSKFPFTKQVEGLSTHNLVKHAKIFFFKVWAAH